MIVVLSREQDRCLVFRGRQTEKSHFVSGISHPIAEAPARFGYNAGSDRASKSSNCKGQLHEPFHISLLTLGLSLAPVLCWAAEPKPKPSDDIAAQLKAAQEERVKVLTDLVKVETELQKTGTVDLVDQLFSAESELCNALLDSTDEPEKRIALLTKQLDKANDVVKILQARYESRTVLPQDVLRAKSQYLGITIKLLRERSRMKPPTPNSIDGKTSETTPTKR